MNENINHTRAGSTLLIGSQGFGANSTLSCYDLTLLWLGTTSLAIIILIFIEEFTAARGLILGCILFSLLLLACSAILKRGLPTWPIDLWLVSFLLVALSLRLNVSTNYMGGQDQGLYVTFSGILNRFHSAYYLDSFRAGLPDAIRALYERAAMASIAPTSDGQHFYSSFYPLHPGWMAMVTAFFGSDAHTWSAVLFSILAVSGAYFLAFELAGSVAARVAGFLMAINPVLCFFAKFPLSESQSAALTLNGLYLLVRALRSEPRTQTILLFGSFLLFVGQLFTRQNFAIFLPPAFVLYVFSYSSSIDSRTGVRLRVFSWSICLSILIAGWVYSKILPELYQNTLGVYLSIVALHPALSAFFFAIVFASVGTLWIAKARLQLGLDRALALGQRVLPWLPLLLVCASIPSLMDIIKTGALYNGMTGEAGSAAVRYHLIYRWLLAVTPAVWLLIILSPLLKQPARGIVLPLLVLCSAWAATQLYTGGTLPYLYYHARFLAGEIIPLNFVIAGILLDAMWKSEGWRRPAAAFVLVSATLTSLPFSILQLKASEGDDASFFHAVDADLGSRDVLLAFEQEMDNRVSVPIRYYFGKQLFLIPRDADSGEKDAIFRYFLENVGSKYRTVLLISRQLPQALPLDLSSQAALTFSETFITNSEHARGDGVMSQRPDRFMLPMKWKSNKIDYQLYQIRGLREAALGLGCPILFSSTGQSSLYVDKGWSEAEDTFRWTDGPEATIVFNFAPKDAPQRIKITMSTGGFDGEQPMQLFLDGQFIASTLVQRGRQEYAFSAELKNVAPIEKHVLRFVLPRAHSPKSIGMNGDPRLLGLSVSALTVDDADSPRRGQVCDGQ